MKKALRLTLLATVLMLAFSATPALAKYAGFNSSMQYVPWTVANSMASQNADAATQAFGPHKGYATTTIKCVVCHSVHRGANKILASGSNCAYCHTTSYYGGAAFANTISWKVTSAGGPHASCGANYCHGGPHGIGASVYAGPASKLMQDSVTDDKLEALTATNGLPLSTLDTWNAQTRVLATGAVCGRTGCHTNSMFGVVDSVTATDSVTIGAGSVTVHGHRVIAAASTNWNVDGRFSDITSKTGQIAWKPVTYCNSCHDLTDDNNGGEAAFPHALTDVISTAQQKDNTFRSAVWLTAAADSGSQTTAVGSYNDYTGSASTTSAAGSSIIDGTCLKCHRSSTAGVGITF